MNENAGRLGAGDADRRLLRPDDFAHRIGEKGRQLFRGQERRDFTRHLGERTQLNRVPLLLAFRPAPFGDVAEHADAPIGASLGIELRSTDALDVHDRSVLAPYPEFTMAGAAVGGIRRQFLPDGVQVLRVDVFQAFVPIHVFDLGAGVAEQLLGGTCPAHFASHVV